MRVIGLCGGSGSGKGCVSLAFEKHGIPVVDTDAVYHGLIADKSSACLFALVSVFGKEILDENGLLDRRRLSSIVFSGEGKEKRQKLLGEITHRFILEKTREWIEGYRKEGKPAVLIDAPLLYESGFDRECDAVIAVIADEETRIERIVLRDGIDKDAARRRIAAQISDEVLMSRADFVIENNGRLDDLSEKVNEIVNKILS